MTPLQERCTDRFGRVRAVGYIRVSEERDGMISPELQEHEITVWANRNNITLVDIIMDLDLTGREFTKRKVKQIVEMIQRGEIRMVVLWKWSRWGRNLHQSQVYLAAVEQAGGIVRAATEDFDPETTMGKFTRDQLLLIAELQSNQISDGWKETHGRRRRAGLPHTASPRFGYTFDSNGCYRPDPATSEQLADAYRRFVGGESMRSIAFDWNRRGFKTTQGNAWTPTALGRMLDTGFAAGLIRERSKPPAAGKNPRTLASFDVWREGAHEAVIDAKTWDAFKKRRTENAAKAPRYATATHPLSGLVVCGICHKRMVSAHSGRNRRHSWRCRYVGDLQAHEAVTISNARAEKIVLEWIDKMATGGEDATARAERQKVARTAVDETAKFKVEIAKLNTKQERLVELWEDAGIDRELYGKRRDRIKEQLEVAQRGLAQAEQQAENAQEDMSRSQPEFVGVRQLMNGEWAAEEKNVALSRMIGAVVVNPGPLSPEKVHVRPRWAGTPR